MANLALHAKNLIKKTLNKDVSGRMEKVLKAVAGPGKKQEQPDPGPDDEEEQDEDLAQPRQDLLKKIREGKTRRKIAKNKLCVASLACLMVTTVLGVTAVVASYYETGGAWAQRRYGTSRPDVMEIFGATAK